MENTGPAVDMAVALRLLEAADEAMAAHAMDSREVAPGGNRDASRRCRTLVAGIGGSPAALGIADPAQIASLLLPIGTASADGSAVFGYADLLFLTEGSNHMLSRPARGQPSSIELTKQWCKLFDARARRQRERGWLLMQLGVPEKISAMPELLPFAFDPDPGAVVDRAAFPRRSQGRADGAGPRPVPPGRRPLCGPAQLAPERLRQPCGRQPRGQLPRLPRPIRASAHEDQREHRHLAYRFFGTPLNEIVSFSDLAKYLILSLWFTRLFEGFHFVWTNGVDDAYADSADLVIGQTMECPLFVAEVLDA